jgi:predicted porin
MIGSRAKAQRSIGQRTQGDSSRAGEWGNSQGFIGVNNPVYGTLTFGRTYTLSSSAIGVYDPVASIAFSQIGSSAIYVGFGAGPTNVINSALTYRLTYQGIRIAAQAQVGGYDIGNSATEEYQLQAGTDVGKLSFDAVGDFARNAVTLSSFAGGAIPPGFDPNSILKATLSNTGGVALLSRYNWDPFKFYLGYVYSRTVNPSDDFPLGLPTIARGIFVPAGFVNVQQFRHAAQH